MRPPHPNARLHLVQLVILLVLLVAPVLALHRLAAAIEPWLLFPTVGVVSLITYFLYAVDKRRAQAGGWRTPESTLHLLELIGGWPGAWVAQRQLRHKTRKVGYQFVFWLIVIAHQFVAVDYVRDWSMSRTVRALINNPDDSPNP